MTKCLKYNSYLDCTRCGKNPAHPSHRWCHVCLAEYTRVNRAEAMSRREAKGRHEGAEEMRQRVIVLMEQQIGDQGMTGWAIARIVRNIQFS
jgi:hypothetical protein